MTLQNIPGLYDEKQSVVQHYYTGIYVVCKNKSYIYADTFYGWSIDMIY